MYDSLYQHLERKTVEQQRNVFPKAIGLDEHSFKRNKYGRMEFVTVVVAAKRKKKRLIEVVHGKTAHDLAARLADFTGAEQVQTVVLDMSKAYKCFARGAFPNAELVADRFHVVRLLGPAVLRRRKNIKAKRTDRATYGVLLRDVKKLDYDRKVALLGFLRGQPELGTVWSYYQRVLGLYKIRGQARAATALTKITDDLAHETIKELVTMRRTLREWRNEILGYFKTRITNARCEGFNNKAKVLKKRAYGFRSFKNYRLRVLSACA